MKRKIIYSALVGPYDSIPKHIVKYPEWEYILFTDQITDKFYNGWQIKPLQKNIKGDPSRTNRWHKLNPHLLFEDCLCSIYIDCNIVIKTNFIYKRAIELIEQNVDIATVRHPFRNCIYQEAKACLKENRDSKENVKKNIEYLKGKKYPKKNGLFENNLFFRNHTKDKLIQFNERWWELVSSMSGRDQLSMCYVLWELDLKCESFFQRDNESIRNSEHFIYHTSHKPGDLIKTISITEYERLVKKADVLKKVKKTISYKVFYKIEAFLRGK